MKDELLPFVQYSELSNSKAVFHWDLGTVRVPTGKTLRSIFFKGSHYYINSSVGLIGGDIIRIGREIETKYRILDNGVYSNTGTRDYRIKRLDDAHMTVLDIENSRKGANIYINTISGKEVLDLMNEI